MRGISIKYFVCSILGFFFLLYTIYPILHTPVYAQQCAGDEDCSQDTYYIDQEKNQCYHKHLGTCEPENQFADEQDCVYAYDLEEDETKCTPPEEPPGETPEESTEPIPTLPTEPTSPSSEEEAIYEETWKNLPKQLNKNEVESSNRGIIEFILQALKNLVGSLFFLNEPQNEEKVYIQSGSIQAVEVPKQLKAEDPEAKEQVRESLGGDTGFYNLNMPDDLVEKGICDSEKTYESINFPKGVKPIIKSQASCIN